MLCALKPFKIASVVQKVVYSGSYPTHKSMGAHLASLFPHSLAPCSKNKDGDKTHKETSRYLRTRRVLLIGAPNSGKTTIFKCLQLISGKKFDNTFRLQRRNYIRKYTGCAIVRILNVMPTLSPPVTLGSLQNKAMAVLILVCARSGNFNLTELFHVKHLPKSFNFVSFVKVLRHDEGFQETLHRRHEFGLADNAQHFVNRMDAIFSEDYLPSYEDILRCPVDTSNEDLYIHPLDLQPVIPRRYRDAFKNFTLKIFDNINNKNLDKRNKWVSYLSIRFVSVIFVVDCSCFDVMSKENSSKNQLQETFELYQRAMQLVNWPSVSIILNKGDVFREKIFSGRRMEDYFADFKNYEYIHHENGEDPEVSKALRFIIDKIQSVYARQHTYFCPPYLTCGTNVEDVRRFFRNCTYTTLMQAYGLYLEPVHHPR